MDENLKVVGTLLQAAAKERKGDYAIYTVYKRQIESLALPSDTIKDAIKTLCDILEV